MKTRRDYTNASGYICPTENTAIYNADRGIKDSYTAPMIRPKVERLKQTPPPPKPKDENLQKARRMYAALCGIAAMMDMSIENITLKVKGDASRYKNNGEKKCVERED